MSAIDFVYRLRPEHLQSFWYFASKVNLAIIGSFGCLLWTTAEGKDEVEFYKTKLSEYKWTLRISSKGVEFMNFAMAIIDASVALLTENTRKLSETAEAPQQNHAQQLYDRAEEDTMIQNYAQDNNHNHALNTFHQLGDDYDPTMDFQGLLGGQDMQVSPSATISADPSADEGVDGTYYGSLDGSEGGQMGGVNVNVNVNEGFDFLPRQGPAGLWMSNVVVNERWPG